MKVISIINFKGGVGKTTLSFHLACYLAQNNRVLLVDVDHQSSLSIVAIGGKIWEQKVKERLTINQVFESFTNRHVQMPKDEIIIKHPIGIRYKINSEQFQNLDFVPSQFELDDTEIDLASTSFGSFAQSEWEKRTLIANWLDKIDAEQIYDYVIFDCPPATKIVSQNAIIASDGYIVPVIPDDMSSRGVTHFSTLVSAKIDDKIKFLRETSRIRKEDTAKAYRETTKMAAIVPYLIKSAGNAASGMTNIHTTQLSRLRRQWGNSVTTTTGKNRIGIPEALSVGLPVWSHWGSNAKKDLKIEMTKICSELKTKIDLL